MKVIANPQSGMTLVELLVGIVLISFIAMMLTGSLQFSARAWERADVHTERVTRVHAAQNVIRRYLGAARTTISGSNADRVRVEDSAVLVGTRESVEFTATWTYHLMLLAVSKIVVLRTQEVSV